MFKYIMTFLRLFLIPIVRQAALEVAVEELNKLAYPKGTKRRRPLYSTREALDREAQSRMQRYAEEDVRKTSNTMNTPVSAWGHHVKHGYHDVLMVAFDVAGLSRGVVEEWLSDRMPTPNTGSYDSKPDVVLDDWWIADDGSCDGRNSAVFVTKGKQAEARELLREHSLLD